MRNTFALAIALSIAGLLVLTLPVTAASHTSSGPLALSRDDKTLVVVNPDSNSIKVFDVSTDTPVSVGRVLVPRDPSSVAISPSGKHAYVASAGAGVVTVVNLKTFKRLSSIKVGAEPQGLALSPNGTRLYVADSASNDVRVFDATQPTLALVATIDLSAIGTAPRAIAVTDNGDANDTDETIFVAMFFGQLRPGKTFLEEGQDDQREGRVAAISAATNSVVGAISLGPLANAGFNSNGRLAPGPNGVPAVASTNPQTFTTPTGAFPNQLAAIGLHPTQSRAYVASTGASPNGPVRFNQNTQGLVSVFDSSTRLEVTAAQTGSSVRRTAPLNLNQGVNLSTTPAPRLFLSNPVDLAWRPDGSDAWVVIQNTNLLVRMTIDAAGIPSIDAPLVAGPSTIVRVDLENPSGDLLAGKAPRGVVINSIGARAYVSNYVSRSVTVVDISNATAPQVVGTAQTANVPTTGSALKALVGAELFYTGRGPQNRMSSEGWGGCVVCHPNGRSDNVTWMFAAGPRQTIALDGSFDRSPDGHQRIFNWSAIFDETQDFELNTRGVFGGRGLIDDDRLFLAIGGASGVTPTDSAAIEQFQQFTGAVSLKNDLVDLPNLSDQANLPALLSARRDFGIATLGDDRVYIVGGRAGAGGGTLVSPDSAVVEFNPRTNVLRKRSGNGFTLRHSLGLAAVQTASGWRVYAIGGYASTDSTAAPVNVVEEYNPDTNRWRTVAQLPTAVAQFGSTVAGGVNTAEPLQLIHIVSGNTGSEGAPSVANPNAVQRFQADPGGLGTWSTFNPAGLTLRRNHGAAAALRGVTTRIFVMGGQDSGGTVLSTVEEYLAQAVTVVATPHTSMPAPRARFGTASTLTTNQIYVVGGVDGTGADQATVFEYTIGNNGPTPGPPGTPSGSWVTRAALMAPRRGLGLSNPPGVTAFLPVASRNRDVEQDAIELFIKKSIRAARAPVSANNEAAKRGRALFRKVGLVQSGVSCATCHGGANWSRSVVDYNAPPSPDTGLGLGRERVIGAELRRTKAQGENALINVGTFTLGGGRVNELRPNPADISQAIAPLGANGFNIPSLLSVHETAPYFYSGLAQALSNVFDGSQDGNGGTRHHFVTDAAQRADLVQFLKSIDEKTDPFP